MTVTEWLGEATDALRLAEPICVEANRFIVESCYNVEQATLLNARRQFFASALLDQVQIASELSKQLLRTRSKCEAEFVSMLQDLDRADEALKGSLQVLESTKIDKALSHADYSNASTLRDFVDENSIDNLRNMLKSAIDGAQSAHVAAQSASDKFASEILTLKEALAKISQDDRPTANKQLGEVHNYIENMNANAHEMAMLLESLARHYDQCQEARDRPDDTTLLQVLAEDSKQVAPTIDELEERYVSVQDKKVVVEQFYSAMKASQQQVRSAFEKFEHFEEGPLKEAVSSNEHLVENHHLYKEEINGLLGQIDDLNDYYALFNESYHALVLEAVRRKEAITRLRNSAKDAIRAFDIAYNNELEERRAFLNERGEFLPTDIWKGLTDPPPRVKIEVEDATSLEFSSDTIDRARKILNGA